ncbi:phage tail protein [Pseudomonas putida]|uniref:phage tail protein n=1 Tax=Pseudomonas putida TaxID=303 RepID=UPI0018E69C2A|nr:phage tail protein [Pseudomonas putida]MBI6957781.1 phage tail protein [Pseudomonas putida]
MGQALKRAPRRATAASKRQVVGSKGGSAKQKQPSIASNSVPSIATVRMLYLWSWGPIVGPVNGLRSVKLDGTPVMAEDGTLTYPGVKWQFRSGELNQERMTGISESSNEIAVGQQLLSTTPYVYTITNSMLDAVRLRFSWPQLQSQDSGGNIDGVRIEYAVDVSTDNGPFQQVLASEVNRKNVTKYERSHRIDLPAGSRWAIRARRITPEANSSLVQDGMYVEAIAEVVDSDQEYPLTAVSCVEYDAEQFGGDIAKIAVLMRGRIVRVPMNYDPVNRTYATSGPGTTNGVWDGTFKESYTNNPAWVFFDLALHPYYGLGDRIDATMINRWSLYRIGQYCDQLVPNGLGGQEPRFTCNLYLQKQAEAWAVLQDLAAIFHGLAFWDGSQITVNADMPQDPVYNYTLSQILDDGAVKYTGSKLRDRHSQAMVSFDDPDRGYDTDKEPVFDESAIAEYGVREISVEAVGCTSRGQAQRAGQWALMTEQLQLRGASFRVGLDGYIPKPGKVITLSDPMLAGRANGGRIAAVAGRVVTVDRDIEVPTGARLLVNLPSGKSEARQVRSVAGRQITVMADFSEVPQPESGWVLDFDDLKLMQFYVRNVTRPEWHQFQLECIQYEPSKFDAIDYGTVIDDRPISVLPPGVQDAPARVLIGSHSSVDQGIAVTTMTISWDAAPGAVAYDVEWRWGSRDWVKVPRTGELAADVRGVYAGQYLARVRAVSSMDVSSIPTTSMLTNVAGKTTPPPAVTHLTTESLLFGIKVTWGFPAGAEDTQRTELWYSEGTDLGVATKLADLAYPQNEHVLQGLRAGQRFFFWARLVDRTGNLGPFFPIAPTVVSGMASADAGPILEQIKDQITESELGQELTDRIDLIDKEGPGSVNERLGEVRSDLNQQIVDVNNSLGQVQSELQQQIDSIADLADSMPYKPDQAYTAGQGTLGEDGKLYQAKVNVPAGNPPPNATYWTDIGQAVQTANGLAARVGTVETSITELNGEVDAQAQQIDGLRTSIDGKADASTVSSLSNRVTQNEQGLSSQGQALTGVQNSLNTTNQNVTAAQQAAQAAADAAGAKGKVLYQSTAPAVADRLAQNLWIDTTGNANTPKRWSGSAWVAVTDKVATDAAAAAASALSQVATKADASTVQALTNTVTQQGQDITAAGQAITSISTSLSQAGGENLLYNPSFDKASAASANVADGWYWRTQTAVAVVPSLLPSALGAGGKRQRLEVSGLIAGTGTHYVDFVPESAPADFRPPVYEGVVGTASIYIRGSSGLMVQIYMQYKDAAGVTIGTHGPVNVSTSPVESYNRIVLTGLAAPAGSVRVDILYRIRSAPGSSITAGFVDLDKAQYEHSPVVTGWRDNGQVNASAIAANATATTALTGRVGLTEQGLTSVSGSITELNNTIGDVGGENLFYNPTFNANGSGSDIADGWAMEGSAVSVDSRVTSWLNSGEKAIRVEVAGVGNAGPYKSVRPTGGTPDRRPKVAEGQTLTASVYLRGTAGLGFRFFLQWINAAGSSISAPNSLMLTVTPGGERVQYSGVAPAGAVSCYVYLRIYSATGAVTSGHVEMARPQFEYGTRATGWRDNGQVNAATTSAVSTAVDSLGSTVTQQGNSITSVSNRTTSLENSVNSTTNGLATKASASALDAVTNRVSAAEGLITSQSNSLTELNNTVGAIQGNLGASGLDAAQDALWQFDTGTEGWTVAGATISAANGVLTVTANSNDPRIVSPGTLAVPGGQYPLIRARITRRAGAPADWDGRVFYSTASHGQSSSYFKSIANPNLAVGQTAVVEWDMSALTAGGTDWVSNIITSIRLDFGNTSGGVFDVDWIAIGRLGPSASSKAVESLSSTVTQQGNKLTAESQRIDGLYASVGDANAAIQNEATARSDGDTALGRRVDTVQSNLGATNATVQQISTAQTALNGKVNATWSVKLGLTSGGTYYAAGFGLGLENQGGTFQSSFVVLANRFAVMNPVGEGLISPFAVQNGQVFISDALISNLAVQKAIVGNSINSSELANDGTPIMRMDFASGTIIMLNKSATAYTVFNRSGIDMVINGVRRIRMGEW